MQNGAPRREATASALGGYFISRDWQILAWQWQCGIGCSRHVRPLEAIARAWKLLEATQS